MDIEQAIINAVNARAIAVDSARRFYADTLVHPPRYIGHTEFVESLLKDGYVLKKAVTPETMHFRMHPATVTVCGLGSDGVYHQSMCSPSNKHLVTCPNCLAVLHR